MKVTKETVHPAYTTQDFVRLVCDICKRETTNPELWNLKRPSGSIDFVRIAMHDGRTTIDGINITHTIFDVCPTCFKGKLVPWLKEQGVEPRTEKTTEMVADQTFELKI